MAFQFLSHFPVRPLLFSIPLSISLTCLPASPISPFHRRSRVVRCDYGGPATATLHNHSWSHSNTAPATSSSSRVSWLSDASLRQISLGSVLGLFAGIGLRIFSKALVLAVGLGILVIEWAASKGYSIVPKRWVQRHVASIDVQRALTQDMPFKTSFGLTMALSAFAEFNSAFA